jgi:microcystin-dependent protein
MKERKQNLGGWPPYDRAEVPAGVILPYVSETPPKGWLLCDGSAVSRTKYAKLFDLVGTTFGGGDGIRTFNVPDLRGRFPLGKDNLGGSSANRVTATQADNIGQGAGAEAVTLTTAQLAAHSHNVSMGSSGGSTARLNVPQDNQGLPTYFATTNTGGGNSHNVMNPYLTLAYIIKV